MLDSVETGDGDAAANARVVVVEDQDPLREMLLQVLDVGGYQGVGFPHGLAALRYLQDPSHHLPCLILLDLMMPVMDGWEFRRAQLADPRLAPVPVVVLSGVGDVAKEAAALQVAAALSKPLKVDQVLEVVGRYC